MAKLYIRPDKLIKAINNGYSDYPYEFREAMKQYGDNVINSIVIVRTPLQQSTNMLLDVISLGQIKQRLKQSPYDDFFHLKIIVNNKYSIEKTDAIIKFTKNNKWLQKVM